MRWNDIRSVQQGKLKGAALEPQIRLHDLQKWLSKNLRELPWHELAFEDSICSRQFPEKGYQPPFWSHREQAFGEPRVSYQSGDNHDHGGLFEDQHYENIWN